MVLFVLNQYPETVADISADSTTVCVGETLTLTASGGVSYEWSTTETTASISAGLGNYTVTVTDANGCTDTDMISISEHPQTVANIGTSTLSVCFGETTTLIASGGTAYSWSTGAMTASIDVGVGTYIVTVTDANGCSDTDMVEITQNTDYAFCACDGDNLTINDNPIPDAEYTTTMTITSNGRVPMGGKVTFNAGQSITLQAPFHAENGSMFTARIEGCVTPLNVSHEEKVVSTVESRDNADLDQKQEKGIDLRVYPNPFTSSTNITYQLAETTQVELQIIDMTGRVIEVLVPKQIQSEGKYQQNWQAEHQDAGVYFLQSRIGKERHITKIILLPRGN